MTSYSKVIMVGNLTRDPETRYTNNNTAITKGSVALNERYKSQSGEWMETVSYVDFVLFGKRGEAMAKWCHKGSRVLIEGTLKQDRWEDKNSGQARSKLEVKAFDWHFMDSKGDSTADSRGSGRRQQPVPAQEARQSDFGGGSDFLDPEDAPF